MKRAKDLVNGKLISVTPTTTLAETARILRDNGVSGCPVVDHSGNLRGIISKTNILDFAVSHEDNSLAPALISLASGGSVGEGIGTNVEAQDVMSGEVTAVDGEAPATEIADLMHRERIHRVPVVQEGVVVGVVTSLDLLGVFGG